MHTYRYKKRCRKTVKCEQVATIYCGNNPFRFPQLPVFVRISVEFARNPVYIKLKLFSFLSLK